MGQPVGKPIQRKEQAATEIAGLASATVADVLSRWPQTTPVFLHHRLACVGCSLSRFERITDVAAVYGFDLGCFVQELEKAAAGLDSGAGYSQAEHGSNAE